MTPEEIEKMRRQIAVLGSLEQGGTDIGDRTIDSTPVEPEVVAPPASRVPIRPRVVEVDVRPKPDDELIAARGGDVDSFNDRATETALRQIVAGITRTRAPDSVTQVTTKEKDLTGRRQTARMNALREMELGRESERETYSRKKDADEAAYRKEKDAKDALWRATEADENQTIRREGIGASSAAAEAMRALAGANFGLRRDEAKVKEQERGDRIAAGTIPLFDGALQTPPGLSDTERGQARAQAGLWNAADEATGQLEGALQAYVANPGPQTAQNITALLGGASTALNTAFGQGAMAEAEAKRMADTLGADIRSVGGITALFDRAMGNSDAGKLLLTKIKTARAGNRATALARLRTSGQFSQGFATNGPTASGQTQAEGSGFVTLVDEAGEELDLPADKAAALLKKNPKMRRK